MIKRRELTDPNSCMSRAHEDEMIFVLLGRDAAAPVAIRAWIQERIRLGKNVPGDAQIVEAEQCAREMEVQQGQKCRCCDRGDEYNGFASGPLLFTCPKHCGCHD